jgi:hypothetical protein
MERKSAIPILILLFLTFIKVLSAQSQIEGGLQVKAIYRGNFVYIRWVPTNFATWQRGNERGYTLARQTVSDNGIPLIDSLRIASTVILSNQLSPISEDEFDALIQISGNQSSAAVAAGAIYSPNFLVTTSGGDPLSHCHQYPRPKRK